MLSIFWLKEKTLEGVAVIQVQYNGECQENRCKGPFHRILLSKQSWPRTKCITWPSIRPVSFQDSPVTYLLLVSLEERYIKITRVRCAKQGHLVLFRA